MRRKTPRFSSSEPRVFIPGLRRAGNPGYLDVTVAPGLSGFLYEGGRYTLPAQILGAGVAGALGGYVAKNHTKMEGSTGVFIGALSYSVYTWWHNRGAAPVAAAPGLVTQAPAAVVQASLQPINQAVKIATDSVSEFQGSPPSTELVRHQLNLRNALDQVPVSMQTNPAVVQARSILARVTSLLDLDEGV